MADATRRCQDTVSCNSKTKITYRDVIILRKIEGFPSKKPALFLAGMRESKNTLKRALIALKTVRR